MLIVLVVFSYMNRRAHHGRSERSYSNGSNGLLVSNYRLQGIKLKGKRQTNSANYVNHFPHQTRKSSQYTNYSYPTDDEVTKTIDHLQQCLHDLQTKHKPSTTTQIHSQSTNLSDDAAESSDENMYISDTPRDSSIIVIHVCDEARHLTKDFECNRNDLLKGMTYFKDYLDGTEDEDVDISVHCDLKIFEWLVGYISQETKPQLRTKQLVSILISSQFLGMQDLVSQCINYFYVNTNDILKLPIDLSCMNDELIDSIAELYDIEELQKIMDPKKKIINRLYRRKLDSLLQSSSQIHQCDICGDLFTVEQWNHLGCKIGQHFVDFHGNINSKHVSNGSWEISKYILGLRMRSFEWSDIYWQIWELTRDLLFCILCKTPFHLREMNHCHYHSKDSFFPSNSNSGTYRCCNSSVYRFHIVNNVINPGCKSIAHKLDDEQNKKFEYNIEKTNTFRDIISLPFEKKCESKPKISETPRPLSARYDCKKMQTEINNKPILKICSRKLYSLGNINKITENSNHTPIKFHHLSKPQSFLKLSSNQIANKIEVQWIPLEEEEDSDLFSSDANEMVPEEIEEDYIDSDESDFTSKEKMKAKTLNQIKDTLRKMGSKPRLPRKYGRQNPVRRTKSKKRLTDRNNYCDSPSQKREWKLDNLRSNDDNRMNTLKKSIQNVQNEYKRNAIKK